MIDQKASFKTDVEKIVSSIPRGKVMTYGQLAGLCGKPGAARIVGSVAHFGDLELPWHRVVNKQGGLASGYPGGKNSHKQVLEQEGVEVKNLKVDIERLIWWPN